ncbi:XRE family transcriptional regulator [Nocardioides cavernaquae]|uniref:XRE family transcriptional regulator n=2 Tax=Nocardioides cavernaquae TaxID=2321396 RepID=A0A3A5H7B2_9ACTN|nr:XRE family transcriptional regulator [Nocardioides cavernaquae]
MTAELTVGERIAWYRQRRGFSQEVLAGFVGRTADWLGKVENGRIELDRVSVLRHIARALDVTLGDLLSEPSLMEWTPDSGQETVPALRAVLMDYRQVSGLGQKPINDEPVALDVLREDLDDVWSAYQESRFGYVTNRLVGLIPTMKDAASLYDGDDRRVASGRLALTYQVAASVLTKLGEADLAWGASDRGIREAQASQNPVIVGSLLRSVAHSLLSTGAFAEASNLVQDTADYLEPHLKRGGSSLVSVYGTALLVGAMAAARNEDRSGSRDFLDEADRAARRLGGDHNRLWTAFGPTNVSIHRVSTAMELGDVQIAVDLGPDLDTSAVPTERRVRHSLEVARALSTTNKRELALAAILDAERIAPEQVRYHYLSRHLVQMWVRTQKGKPSHQLAGLAQRLNVA